MAEQEVPSTGEKGNEMPLSKSDDEGQQTTESEHRKKHEEGKKEAKSEQVANTHSSSSQAETTSKNPKEDTNEGSSAQKADKATQHNAKDDLLLLTEEAKAAILKGKEEIEKKMKRSFKFFGLEFAPMIIPLERRLQTLTVVMSLLVGTQCPIFLSGFLMLLLFTPLFFIPLGWLLWFYLDRRTPHRGGRRLAFIRNLPAWRYVRDYFPISFAKTANLDPSRNYLIGYHPHGILVFGGALNFCTEANRFSELFPGIKPTILTLNAQFRWPLIRSYYMALGMCAVSRESIKHLLTKNGNGNAVVIVIGGAEEALEARPGSFAIVLRNRKGFVRQAITHGADLVPCFSFGENDVFKQMGNTHGSKLRIFQYWFKRLTTYSPPLYYGRGIFNYTFGYLPFRRPIDTVVGKPIRVERDENPSEELVDHYHKLYLDGLYELFEENKERHGIAQDVHIQYV